MVPKKDLAFEKSTQKSHKELDEMDAYLTDAIYDEDFLFYKSEEEICVG